MSNTLILAIVLGLGILGYLMGSARSLAVAGGDRRQLHSLPIYYGAHVGLNAIVPAFLFLAAWLVIQPFVINNTVSSMIPESAITEGSSLGLIMSDVRRVADGLDLLENAGGMSAESVVALAATDGDVRQMLAEVGVALGSDVRPETLAAAQRYREMLATGNLIKTVLTLVVGGSVMMLGAALLAVVPYKDAPNTVTAEVATA